MTDSIHYYDASIVGALREGISSSLRIRGEARDLATGERVRGEDVAREGDGYYHCEINPAALSKCLKHVELDPAYGLVGFVYRSFGNGNGMVYAVPSDDPWVRAGGGEEEGVDPTAWQLRQPVPGVEIAFPKPETALDNFMEAFRGDGSPLSYLEASLLMRGLYEYGAGWHGVSWDDASIITSDPFAPAGNPTSEEEDEEDEEEEDPRMSGVFDNPTEWTWHAERPSDWRLSVATHDDGRAELRFHTHHGEGVNRLYQHSDCYSGSSLVPECEAEEIATGGPGYVH